MTTIGAALVAARAKLPANEARLVLGHVLQREPAWLLAHDDEILGEDELLSFASLVARRAGGEPVAYLLGHREFFGRRFSVSPAVLIPRPETELLVELAMARLGGGTANLPGNPILRDAQAAILGDGRRAAPRILDLGTGSGCIAITLALELPQASVTAVDVSREALEVAARNARSLGASVRLVHGDWFSALGDERFDLVVSNPPYVAAEDSHLARGDLRYEPRQALVSGADGLEAIRAVISGAFRHLRPGASLLIEHGYDQALAVGKLLDEAGFVDISVNTDLAGVSRVSGGILRRTGEDAADSR